MKQHPAHGRTAKHAGAHPHKHAQARAHSKHHPAHHPAHPAKAQGKKQTVKAKHPHHAKARQLSPGLDVACCSAEALAASLRLTGRTVGADDVLALYWHTAAGPDAGAPVLATLQAACEHGLAGVRPVSFEPVDMRGLHMFRAGWLLGLQLVPGPHAVAVGHDGCWLSWGQHYDPAAFPCAVVEEAWVVAWP